MFDFGFTSCTSTASTVYSGVVNEYHVLLVAITHCIQPDRYPIDHTIETGKNGKRYTPRIAQKRQAGEDSQADGYVVRHIRTNERTRHAPSVTLHALRWDTSGATECTDKRQRGKEGTASGWGTAGTKTENRKEREEPNKTRR